MAAVLRCAARKICGHALQRPQAYFTTAAEAAVKEGRRRLLLPRISHGASSLRRFTSSESTTLLNNSNNTKVPAGGLAKQVDLRKQELLSLLRQSQGVDAATSSMGADNTELLRLIRGSNRIFLSSLYKSMAGTLVAIVATVYLEAKLIKGRHNK
ncbi:unnamed protein product [Alopecurus aequalis]